jgi:uncharacterized protein YabE (DUF348 family)
VGKVNRKSIYILSAAAVALLIGGTATASSAYKTVTIDVDGQQQQLKGFQFGTIKELLGKQGIQVKKEDLVQPAESTKIADGTNIVVKHAKSVVVQDGTKESVSVNTQASTVADLLKELKISVGESDKTSMEVTAAVKSGQSIKITRRTEQVSSADETIPFQTERQPDAEIYTGTEKVLTPGVEGKATLTTKVVLEDGKEVDRKVERTVAQDAVNQVVAYGTKSRPVVVASRSGDNFTSEKTLTMAASAYSMPGARTASGGAAGPGTVAVDPSVIPLGTKLYIEGYGYAVASDVGGAIKGNRIDVHFDSEQAALQFGRRIVTVHILGN